MKQREWSEKIVELTGELNFAKDRYKTMQIEEEKKRQAILDSKLKEKGPLLLNKKS